MLKLTKFLFSATLLASFLFFTSCEKDDTEPDSPKPTLEVGDDIIGMTGENYPMNVTVTNPDGNDLTLTWTVIESPDGSNPEIKEIGKTSSSFTTDIAGLYKVEITASNGQGKSDTGILTLYIGGVLPTSITSNTVYPDLFDNEDYPDYYAPKSIEINAGVTLEPGVIIESGADVRFRIIGNSAFLNAEGTAAKNIIFRGMDKVKGSWKTLHLASNDVNNKLNFVQILHAGSSEQSGQKAALFIQSNTDTRVSIKNTTIAHSDGYGLYVNGDSGNITEFSNNNFSHNSAAPIRFGAMNTYMLDKNSIFENNGIQAIELAGGTTTDFNTSGTVVSAGLPYHVYSSFHLKADVTFESGVTCRFDKGMRMRINADAAIIAIAESDPITFEGLVAAQGAWVGMTIESPSPLNNMDGVIIRHGGDVNGLGGNIHLFGSTPGSQLTIVNSIISDSETWGIHSSPGDANLTQSGNTFFNNKLGDILQE